MRAAQEGFKNVREARENYFDALRKTWLDERQRLVGVGIKSIGAAKFIRADGHRVAAVSRPPGVRSLRILYGVRLRGTRKVLFALHHDS